jgi:hypothetical protein
MAQMLKGKVAVITGGRRMPLARLPIPIVESAFPEDGSATFSFFSVDQAHPRPVRGLLQ